MMKDLSHLIKDSRPDLREYLVKYLLSIINIEVTSLPPDSWEKTLQTWKKILLLADQLRQTEPSKRQELYGKWKMDGMMVSLLENLIDTINRARQEGLLKEKERAYHLLRLAAQYALEREDLLREEGISHQLLDLILKT